MSNININNKQFIYYPAFTVIKDHFIKNKIKVGNLDNIRFYDQSFPERFKHPYFLLTGYDLYKRKGNIIEEMGLQDSTVIMDSGGFQIANGTTSYSDKYREEIFQFLEHNANIAMLLDIPPKIKYEGKFNECLDQSVKNFKYFADYHKSKTKFLNILQTDAKIEQAQRWYHKVKQFQFNGWAVGGTNVQHYNAIAATALLLQNREFEKKENQYLHFFGVTNPFSLFLYAAIQKNMNQYYPHVQVMTDSSTPSQQPNNGNILLDISMRSYSFQYHKLREVTPYPEGLFIPCTIDCPVCTNIKLTQIMALPREERHLLLSLHNLFKFNRDIDFISKIVNANMMRMLIPKEVEQTVHTIDRIFDEPEQALKEYAKHISLYNKASKKIIAAEMMHDEVHISL